MSPYPEAVSVPKRRRRWRQVDGDAVTLRVPKAETARVAAALLEAHEVLDLTIEDPPIEDVIELVFAQERPGS